MREMSVNQFRSNLKEAVGAVLRDHDPLRVTRRGGGDFVVVSAEDWERDRETLLVLENTSLMQQIAESTATYEVRSGRVAPQETLDAIDRVRG